MLQNVQSIYYYVIALLHALVQLKFCAEFFFFFDPQNTFGGYLLFMNAFTFIDNFFLLNLILNLVLNSERFACRGICRTILPFCLQIKTLYTRMGPISSQFINMFSAFYFIKINLFVLLKMLKRNVYQWYLNPLYFCCTYVHTIHILYTIYDINLAQLN